LIRPKISSNSASLTSERVVLDGQLFVRADEIQADRIACVHDLKRPERARRGEAQDLRQEGRGRQIVARMHNRMIQLGQGLPPLPLAPTPL
jgi:hypothetical protein